MKKKFSLWLNIVTICLCFAAIAIGVYAATSATLTVSGQIGFEAHGVEMTIDGTITGYVTSPDSDERVTTKTPLTKSGNNLTLPQKVYFTDLVESRVSDITIELTVSHTSAYPIEVSLLIDDSVPSNISFDITNQVQTLAASSNDTPETGTITIVMNVYDANTGFDAEEAVNNLNLTVYAEKEQLVRTDSEKGDYLIMGHKLVNGEVKPVRWFPFAKTADNGTTWTKFDPVTDKIVEANLGKGNYYFVSEYVLDVGSGTIHGGNSGVAYNNTYTMGGKYLDVEYPELKANNYLLSDVRSLLNGNTVQKEGKINNATQIFEAYGEYINLFSSYAIDGSIFKKIISRPAVKTEQVVNGLYEYQTGETAVDEFATQSDKLWLLSESDITYLPNVENISSKDTDLITQTFRDAINTNWWLRSPHKGYDNFAKFIRNDAHFFNAGVVYSYGIRPGFQI